ncbi:acetamidase/formamidase family protein [Facklamia sp. DSM 111018]|uniref:Acetamidase/formamidase family protein n=1 Tax=Facklamia lactis TaxID=2749967 RepID=A0ABS0LPW0_9LACT|nr:acetamidase/formamidase family protein [Facklamia lactis]MBG9986201.1 acetamidase/formamidase family protein [Facklamia lactis]
MNFKNVVYVNEFTNGVLDPVVEMQYFVKDGGHIIANTAPGCWGPMITPKLQGGHEVTKPVYVEGAEVGDAIIIHIEDIHVTSLATASGSDQAVKGAYTDDAFIDAKCPHCGILNPETYIDGYGKEAIKCKNCDKSFLPFDLTNGYTIKFDNDSQIGITLNEHSANAVAKEAKAYMNTPENSIQNPIATLAPHDIVGAIARMRPFLGQLGTTPSQAFPDSHNAGDFAQALLGASHAFGKTEEDLNHRTDGHMDINRVRVGAKVIAPVKVAGAGVYLGDMHAMQGNGEIAGHTADVSGVVRLKIEVIKELTIEGPILLSNEDDLPYLAKPLTEKERALAKKMADQLGIELEESYPISFIGTGATLNEATDNAVTRAAKLFGVCKEEILNRCTITGSIDIGRHPGVVTATFLAPKGYLEKIKMLEVVKKK